MFYCWIVLLLNCSIVELFYCWIVLWLNRFILRWLKFWIVYCSDNTTTLSWWGTNHLGYVWLTHCYTNDVYQYLLSKAIEMLRASEWQCGCVNHHYLNCSIVEWFYCWMALLLNCFMVESFYPEMTEILNCVLLG